MESTIENTIVVVPSYNEVRAIGEVVRSIVSMGLSVLVIDDGSTDSTERVALDNGAMVIRHKKNLGKGFSIREGIKHVIEKTNYKWMIMMDGDGQHHPEDVPALMGATRDQEVAVVNGNRMLETDAMPFLRYHTNRSMSWLVSKMCGQKIPDTQCGYRLISVDALMDMELKSKKYDIESEILFIAAQKNMKIVSVPIKTIYGEEVSEIHPVRDAIRFFSLVLRHNFNGLRQRNKKNDQ